MLPAWAEPCVSLSACVQELKTMVADDAMFKADGVIYTQDTKGTLGLPLSVRRTCAHGCGIVA